MLQVILIIAAAYIVCGLLFAVAFVIRGVDRVDPAASGSTRPFRMMIFPGAAALWPLLLKRWLSPSGPPREPSLYRIDQSS